MICIRVTRRDSGLEISAEGHAGYAPVGQDIVCAGVSALLYGFVAYLRETLPIATAKDSHPKGRAPLWEVSEGDGRLWVRTHGSDGRDKAAFASIEAGLRLIAACYPHHVTLDTDTKGDTYESS
jgi:uncharacterized protein YsxB (DUF464 family)